MWSAVCLAIAVACGGGGKSGQPTSPAPAGGTSEPGATTNPGVPAPPAVVEPSAPVGHPREDLIPRAVLFGNPERGAPQISPDGKLVAFTAPADGVMNVFVAPIGDLGKAVQVTHDTNRPIRSYFWSWDGKWIVYFQDVGGDENFHAFRVGVDGKDALDLTPKPGAVARLHRHSPKHPGTLLLGLNDRDPKLHDVYEVDLATGKSKLVFQNPGYVGFVVDDDLKVRLAARLEPDGGQTYLAPGKDLADAKAWTTVQTFGFEDSANSGPSGFDATGKQYYLSDSRGRDTAGLFLVSTTTKKATLIADHPKADVGGVIKHPTTGKVRAVAFNRTRTEWKIVDRTIAKDLAALAKLDEGDLAVTSMTKADDVWIVAYSGDRRPARFWKWDRKKQKGTFLYAARPALESLPLARMTPEIIPARDGLELVSYLTLPVASDPDGDGRPGTAVPMVLLVHGGPWARDAWGFNPLAQLLANRGYAVLQVNYRGSTGFGKAFVNASTGQWGKKMHDDLLDAVAWATTNGITTADAVCIMGGSYGGYATLAGLTLTPKTFRCGVDIVGVSSIPTLLESVPPYWVPLLAMWKARVGDHTTPEGRAALLAVSPLTHAGKIERPLLIAHGANDPRVKRAESDQIVKTMTDKGLPVTYALFPDEGHGFARPENNGAFMALAEAFLSAHLGGSYQPMTEADFAGSTLQVLAGRAGIPGLPTSVGKPAK